jgi:hypothetical protein
LYFCSDFYEFFQKYRSKNAVIQKQTFYKVGGHLTLPNTLFLIKIYDFCSITESESVFRTRQFPEIIQNKSSKNTKNAIIEWLRKKPHSLQA